MKCTEPENRKMITKPHTFAKVSVAVNDGFGRHDCSMAARGEEGIRGKKAIQHCRFIFGIALDEK